MSRAAQRARMDAYAARDLRETAWGTPLIPERVVDLTDASQFPEMALAREHARKLRIVEMPKSTPSSMEDRHVG